MFVDVALSLGRRIGEGGKGSLSAMRSRSPARSPIVRNARNAGNDPAHLPVCGNPSVARGVRRARDPELIGLPGRSVMERSAPDI